MSKRTDLMLRKPDLRFKLYHERIATCDALLIMLGICPEEVDQVRKLGRGESPPEEANLKAKPLLMKILKSNAKPILDMLESRFGEETSWDSGIVDLALEHPYIKVWSGFKKAWELRTGNSRTVEVDLNVKRARDTIYQALTKKLLKERKIDQNKIRVSELRTMLKGDARYVNIESNLEFLWGKTSDGILTEALSPLAKSGPGRPKKSN